MSPHTRQWNAVSYAGVLIDWVMILGAYRVPCSVKPHDFIDIIPPHKPSDNQSTLGNCTTGLREYVIVGRAAGVPIPSFST